MNSTTNVMPSYKLLRKDAGGWAGLGTILANSIPDMLVSSTYTMPSDRMDLKVDSQGHFHIVVQAELNGPGNTVIYCYSANGSSWSFTNLGSNNSGTDGSLVYTTNTGGSCSAPQVLAQGDTGAAACVRDSIVVDGGNKVTSSDGTSITTSPITPPPP